MNKQKELKAIDVQVEEELDSQVKRVKQTRDDEKMALQRKLAASQDPNEKSRLLAELAETEKRLQKDIDEEQRNQSVILEERRRRKADRMAIRKMRIEHDQLEDVLTKELNMNNTKFADQIAQMSQTSNELMNQQIKEYLHPDHTNKEQSLILISEINDQLLERIQKML